MTAEQWMHRGADLLDDDLDRAETCYRRALDLDAGLRGAWFDLGLVHKWRREWAESLACNRKAAELGSEEWPDKDPAYWNGGIAATALEDWEAARWAWRGYGIPIPDGPGPIEEDFGLGVVRLPGGETVWGRRIDPARIVLRSVPLPGSGFRCGDIVLHDGVPAGTRVSGGREYSVFDAISRWRASPVPTVEVVVDATPAAVDSFMADFEAHGIPAEDWTKSVVLHCVACSMGRVDYDSPDHQHHQASDTAGSTTIGCSGELATVEPLVRAQAGQTGAIVLSVSEVG